MSTAILLHRYGGVDELFEAAVPVPRPGPGEVVVRYEAIGVNPIDWKLLRGDLRHLVPLDLPACLGVEAAGTVVEVGAEVDRFRVGDAVIRHGPPGTYRTHEAVPAAFEADQLTPAPARFPAEQAAVLPVAAGTAYSALRQVGFRAGERLLVHGASGGVGLAVVQLARILGARQVLATGSAEHHELLRRLGATPVEYGPGLVDRLARFDPPDASVDCAGGPQPTDTAVTLVADPGRRVTIVPDARAQALGVPFLQHLPAELPTTLDVIGDRPFALPIRERYPLRAAARALARGQRGGVGGRLVLVPEDPPPGGC